MKHLLISREFPPASYPPGGIGTYAANIARLLAERDETVHVIAERWTGAPHEQETLVDGRLIIHRIGIDDVPSHARGAASARLERELAGLKKTAFPHQWFSWHAAFLAEELSAEAGIDVIEGQEWEAPLYYLLLRRALGLAAPLPPCIVHLHSATAFIRHYNGAIGRSPTEELMERMEEFCIRSADALLCPSAYYAAQCVDHFGLPRDSIRVIPLPVGLTTPVERASGVWEDGSICFVGRIEPRKGIIEWLAAAARVATEQKGVQFDFVGADQLGLQSALQARLAPELRQRFRFHGSKSRAEVLGHLAGALAAVVPSRWENFPNVCVEAMGSGLPVIATRFGGMVEMVEDGRTGWLAPDDGVAGMVDGLAAALRRCLATSPEVRAAMGAAASHSIAQICDNDSVSDAHVRFRIEVAEGRARRSVSLAGAPDSTSAPAPSANASVVGGSGIVIRARSLDDARPVLNSLRMQEVPAAAIVVVCSESSTSDESGSSPPEGDVLVLDRPELRGTDAWNAGFDALRSRPIGSWWFLDEHDALEPTCLARVEQVFAHRPEVGIVSPWTLRIAPGEQLEAPLCADLHHQMVGSDVVPASAFRAEAMTGERPFRTGMPRELDVWDVANAVLVEGWAAATLPEALATRTQERVRFEWPESTAVRAIRGELLARFEGTMSRATLDLVDDFVPLPGVDGALPMPSSSSARRYLTTIVLHPRRAVRAARFRFNK